MTISKNTMQNKERLLEKNKKGASLRNQQGHNSEVPTLVHIAHIVGDLDISFWIVGLQVER